MRSPHVFADRSEAGRQLAQRLLDWRGTDVLVVALPRGGVPVAAEVARALGAPLDVVVVRKAGVPWQPELAMGAVGEGGVRVVNSDVLDLAGVSPQAREAAFTQAHEEVVTRTAMLRGGRTGEPITGRSVIVVDDGVATGATATAAVKVLRARGAARVVVASPVASVDGAADLASVADAAVFVSTPPHLSSIGEWYRDFRQVEDHEVVRLLAEARPQRRRLTLLIPVAEGMLPATVTYVRPTAGLVLFAHGSGSSRLSPRNVHVAERLHRSGFGTVLFDLLTEGEATDPRLVFDVPLLGERLLAASRWVRREYDADEAPLAYFGASTGTAAALYAAAKAPDDVAAVVSRGGRPDLATPYLRSVQAPTLLIVGGADTAVLAANRRAAAQMRCPVEVRTVPGATHLFQEPGTLTRAADLAAEWLEERLVPHGYASPA